jgi:hypothetical protein
MKTIKKTQDYTVYAVPIRGSHPAHGGPCAHCGEAGGKLWLYGVKGNMPLEQTYWYEQPFCSVACAEDFGLAPFV